MWWEDKDYAIFKESALAELRNLVLQRGKMDTKTALNILYQPNSNNNDIEEKLEIKITDNLPSPPPSSSLSSSSSQQQQQQQQQQQHIIMTGLDSCRKPSLVILTKGNNNNNILAKEELNNSIEKSVLENEQNFQ